jgi:phosphoadenosine phosphosulfate reductase
MIMDELKRQGLEKKIEDAKKVIREALAKYKTENIAITWTGGKDSTMVLWLFRQVCDENGVKLPVVFSIDEYDHFDEVHAFMESQARAWGIEVKMLINQDLVDAAGGELNNLVKVTDLNERNQKEIHRLGYEEDEFPFEAESYVGNHLMKTVPFNLFLEEDNIQAVVQGLRWDEHPSRAHDEYFMYREPWELSPGHMRVNPILHFTERDIWDINLNYGVPYNNLYKEGYRSLGARSTSMKFGDLPAWEQDLENTGERDGRRQDKEAAMDKLRALGYM